MGYKLGILENIVGSGIKYGSLLSGLYIAGIDVLQDFNVGVVQSGLFRGTEVSVEDYFLPLGGIIIGSLIDKAGDRNLRRADLKRRLLWNLHDYVTKWKVGLDKMINYMFH